MVLGCLRFRKWILVSTVAGDLPGTRVRRPSWPSPTDPSARDRQITLAVSMLMDQQNLTGHGLDDTISQRCLDTFIKELDPLKLFFYQSDVDEFMKNKRSPGRIVQARRHQVRLRRFRPLPDPRRRAGQRRPGRARPAARLLRRRRDGSAIPKRSASPRRPKRRPTVGGNACQVRPLEGDLRRRARWTKPSRSSASATTASARAGSKPTTTSCSSGTSPR